MDSSQKRFSPGFLFGVFAVLVFLGWFVSTGVPTEKEKTRAKVLSTRTHERQISFMLENETAKMVGATNLSLQIIMKRIVAAEDISRWISTNSAGELELVDVWQTPYRIELAGHTNFIVRSAGPNQKFGDLDDVVFNSSSKEFVTP